MQGKDEIEAQARLSLFKKAIQGIEKQINNQLNNDQILLKLLAELKDNSGYIENNIDRSKSNEQLFNLASVGKQILEELEQIIKTQNRNIAALLEAEFKKVKDYYAKFLPKENTAIPLSNNPSQSMSHFIAGRNIYAEQHAHQHIHQPHLPAEKLPEMWNVPPRNRNFTGREELLKQMTAYFNAKESKHLVLTAYGLGGIGKTQLTLEYVWSHYKEYNGVCWFNAESREQLINNYVSLGQELHLFAEAEKNLILEEKAKIIKTWLEDPKRAGWLLIYDSALKQDDMNDLLPVKEGKILITSRHTHWPQYQTIAVGLFNLKEAQDYMKKIIGEQKFSEESANQLIKLLGYLPLAIAQACAYIQRNEISIADYLDLYHKKHEMLLNEQLLSQDQYQKAVAVTWNITLEQMMKEAPESVELMHCCSYLHHNKIPEILVPYFFEGADEVDKKHKALKAKRVAKEYSMIAIDEQRQIFSMHSLVQKAIRENSFLQKNIKYFQKENQDVVVSKLISIFDKHILVNIDNLSQMQTLNTILPYIEHAVKLTTYIGESTNLGSSPVSILTKIGLYQSCVLGDDMSGIEKFKKALLSEKRIDHLKLAEIYKYMGMLHDRLYNAREAIFYYNESLKSLNNIFKTENEEHGKIYVNLGITHYRSREYDKAINSFLKGKNAITNLFLQKERLAKVNFWLGLAFYYIGKKSEAKKSCVESIEYFQDKKDVNHVFARIAYSKILSNHKENRILIISNLKIALSIGSLILKENLTNAIKTFNNKNEPWKALEILDIDEQYFTEKSEIIKNLYGDKHLEFAECLSDLGMVYENKGDYILAEHYYKKALEICQLELGDVHCNTRFVYEKLNQKKEGNFYGSLFKGMFSKLTAVQPRNKIEMLFKKYRLPDSSQSSLEKGLRMAATNNQVEDIDILIEVGININAQDNGTHKRTALHWATIKKRKECIKKLLENGAQFDITDVNGKTAYDYAREANDNELFTLFSTQQIKSPFLQK